MGIGENKMELWIVTEKLATLDWEDRDPFSEEVTLGLRIE